MRVIARDKTGIVILRDKRANGSYVLLECQEFTPSGGGGVLGLPDDEEVFPMLEFAVERTRIHAERTRKKPFRLEVDISAMPPGELRFHNREFIEHAAEESEVAERAEITPDNAEQWGYVASELGAM